ncbi:MAG: glycerophosphodiester phosphodiesterase family protein [Clostridia bacterium]|nr:glycerophosphodiester phosphodiesterase family protein [Clostridia bacterium]
MLHLNRSIWDNRQAKGMPLLAAHRGVCGGNIPCNTMAAFRIALDQGADVVELDVSKTKDGHFLVFHPGMEPVFLKTDRRLKDMTLEEIRALPLVNQDDTATGYSIPTLEEAFAFLKDKVYINVDKFWTDVPGISEEIRRAGVEQQVIVKTGTKPEYLDAVKRYASDFMFMPLVRERDDVTEALLADGVKVIGAEILLSSEEDEVISDAYIQRMHQKGLLIWMNAIVYDERAVISAYHTDDRSLTDDPAKGWGWLADKGADFIQTDWLLAARAYLERR